MIVKTQQEKKCYKNSFPEEKINKELNIRNKEVSKSKNLLKIRNGEIFG